MPSQTEAGKAFEYALLIEINEILGTHQTITIREDDCFNIAENCYGQFDEMEKSNYKKAVIAAIEHLLDLEPRLENPLDSNDLLELQIVPDSQGIQGDVRDILVIRSRQQWEIGLSAKNHHRAVKHSRLSDSIDFGNDWLENDCSEIYFNSIRPIFSELRNLRTNGELWRNLEDKHARFYIPILNAFKTELLRLDSENPTIIPGKLLKYLIGNKDFYKIIKGNNITEIQGFNLNGTLNKSINAFRPRVRVSKLRLPTRIIELVYKPNSTDTLILTCDEGWQISFRIHNASSRVEPSLKFDINLIGHPQSLYSNHISWN